MKHIVFTGIFLFLLSNNAIAQQKKIAPEKLIDKQLEKAQEKLELNNLQLLMIKEVILKYQHKKTTIQKQEIPNEEKRIQIREIHLKQQKELAQFLNEEQLIAFNKIMKNLHKETQQNRPKRKGNGNRKGRRNSF